MKFLLALAAMPLQAELAYGQFETLQQNPSISPSPTLPPNKTVTVYHMFEPKYTGLANKDGGDFMGDASFIFLTFNPLEVGNPEADITDNIFEMSTVTVEDWGTEYIQCTAPGTTTVVKNKTYTICPSTSSDYCCHGNKTEITADTLPAWENLPGLTGGEPQHPAPGYWFSFPKASEGTKWTETVERRIKSACLGEAWRSDAGGCPECGNALDECVSKCIESALAPISSPSPLAPRNYTKLQATWDRVFQDKALCPDQPFPGVTTAVLV